MSSRALAPVSRVTRLSFIRLSVGGSNTGGSIRPVLPDEMSPKYQVIMLAFPVGRSRAGNHLNDLLSCKYYEYRRTSWGED